MSRPNAQSPSVLLVRYDQTDHFVGLEAALGRRGLRAVRDGVMVDESTAVVVVMDTTSTRARWALRQARKRGVPTILLMDGIVEYRNTFLNPALEPGFLESSPVDVIACAGENDRLRLKSLGNRAVATGLPRLERMERCVVSGESVLVATAKTPAFGDKEHELLVAALGRVRAELEAVGVPTIWRLTGGLETEIGVENDSRTLGDALSASRAVITTPSTVLVEAMLSGRPTALLHPFETPRWQEAAWILDGAVDRSEIRSLIEPSAERLVRQEASLAALFACDPSPTEALAALCDELAARPERAPVVVKRGRPRVLSLVACDHSPVGGVTVWSQRLARAMGDLDPGYDMRTLLIVCDPQHWDLDTLDEWIDDRTDVCMLDPGAEPWEAVETIRQAVDRIDPDVILPNSLDACYAVAMQRRAVGTRVVAIGHTDAAYYRRLMNAYPGCDAYVGVSGVVRDWLGTIARGAPLERIVYGVPVGDRPRAVRTEGPLRIAYVGRMIEQQKRIRDLLGVIDGLEHRGVAHEFHIVGDGFQLDQWRKSLAERTLVSGKVIVHGAKPASWVEAFWATVDVVTLVSEYEGTSITMLEAMGVGVVPVVTRIASGVGEWIEEGRNGLTAPVGEPDQIAAQIALLADNSELLSRMSHKAWESARGQSVAAMAEKYCSLFDAVRSTPPVAQGPTDVGLRLIEYQRWSAGSGRATVEAESWAAVRLKEAGYQRPGRDDEADAYIAGAGDSLSEIATRRDSGRGVVRVPHLLDVTVVDRMRELILGAVEAGRHRVAIYGTGRHTRRASRLFELDLPIVGFIDDAARKGDTLWGLPVVPLDRCESELRPDAVVISSDMWEDRMLERCAALRQAGVEIIPIYADPAFERARATEFQSLQRA